MLELIVLLLLQISGLLFAFRNSKKHFLLVYVTILLLIYHFLSPLHTLITKNYVIFGTNIRSSFSEVILLYTVGYTAFLFCYILAQGNYKLPKRHKSLYKFSNKANLIIVSLVMAVVFITSRKLGWNNSSDYSGGYLNYILFLSDSLVLVFVIFILENRHTVYHYFLLFPSLVMMLILGFRYRIILFLIGIIYHSYIASRISLKSVVKWTTLIVICGFFLNFITINRHSFRSGDFDEFLWQEETSKITFYGMLMHQTGNHKADMALYKYMTTNSKDFDYGESMFLNIVYRFLPANIFASKLKPKIPQQELIKSSFSSIEGRYAGSALTSPMSYYIAFGHLGVVLFMGLTGYYVGFVSLNSDLMYIRDRVKVVIIAMLLFQEITRAYFPQTFTLMIFLILPLRLLYKYESS